MGYVQIIRYHMFSFLRSLKHQSPTVKAKQFPSNLATSRLNHFFKSGKFLIIIIIINFIKHQHFSDWQHIILSSLFILRYNPVREAEENLMPTTEDIWKLLHDRILNSFSSVKQAFLVFDDVSVISETGVWWTWPYWKDLSPSPSFSAVHSLFYFIVHTSCRDVVMFCYAQTKDKTLRRFS